MIAELGYLSLIIASCFALLQAVIPIYGLQTKNYFYIKQANLYAVAVFAFMLLSFLALMYSFGVDDFSVTYVAQNSNTLLPLYYKLPAVWGGHEGSLLLWLFILSSWSFLLAIFGGKNIDFAFLAQVLSITGFIAFGFGLFIIFTSNPFVRDLFNSAAQGADLNPLLQDFGLIVHPPMLYIGYVGLSVSFAFAVTALLQERVDPLWIVWCKPWLLGAWAFLTLGITLGSWWAYYELGWGGWWFWDPVENASFMPWLLGTALVHSIFLNEKRAIFHNWTKLLAIFAFCLSLLGTFIVRSGILTSVHSFASDPERGLFILILILIVMLSSLFIYAIKSHKINYFAPDFALFSKDTVIILGNILLITASFSVLLGTLYPVFMELLGYGKVSVGAPYFNLIFVPIVLLLALLMGISPLMHWHREHKKNFIAGCLLNFLFSCLCTALFFIGFGLQIKYWAVVGVFAAFWIVFPIVFLFTKKLNTKLYSMFFAHLGIAFAIFGVSMTSNYEQEDSFALGVNDQAVVAGYNFTLTKVKHRSGENYIASLFDFTVRHAEDTFYVVSEKRFYQARDSRMTEAGIDWSLLRDIYIAVGEQLDGGKYAVRINYKPFIRFLWFGGLLIVVGALFALISIIKNKYFTINSKEIDICV